VGQRQPASQLGADSSSIPDRPNPVRNGSIRLRPETTATRKAPTPHPTSQREVRTGSQLKVILLALKSLGGFMIAERLGGDGL